MRRRSSGLRDQQQSNNYLLIISAVPSELICGTLEDSDYYKKSMGQDPAAAKPILNWQLRGDLRPTEVRNAQILCAVPI